jgi:hypothetical protein
LRLLRPFAWGCLIALSLGLSACHDRVAGLQKIGVAVDDQRGLPIIVVYPCPGQTLTQVDLWLLSKSGADRIRLLWRIHRSEGTTISPTKVTAGDVPDGFTQDLALVSPSLAGSNLEFVAQFGPEMEGKDFRMQDLRANDLFVAPEWFGNHSHVSLDQFQRENERDCSRS